jgi:hypothetical protein
VPLLAHLSERAAELSTLTRFASAIGIVDTNSLGFSYWEPARRAANFSRSRCGFLFCLKLETREALIGRDGRFGEICDRGD